MVRGSGGLAWPSVTAQAPMIGKANASLADRFRIRWRWRDPTRRRLRQAVMLGPEAHHGAEAKRIVIPLEATPCWKRPSS
jgi:hypothetical protein